jgi:ApeA-like protein
LPGSDAVAGTLHNLDDGHLRLELTARLYPVDGEEFMLLGETRDGPVTLLQCLTEQTTIDGQDINVGQCLRGLHLASPDEARFTSTTLRIEYLLGWLGDRTTFGLTIEEEDGRRAGQQTVTTKPLDDLVVTVGDFEFTFAVVFDPFKQERHGRANELRMVSTEWCELTIGSKTALLPYSGSSSR